MIPHNRLFATAGLAMRNCGLVWEYSWYLALFASRGIKPRFPPESLQGCLTFAGIIADDAAFFIYREGSVFGPVGDCSF